MPLKELSESDKNIAFAIGFVRGWITGDPQQLKDQFEIVANGIYDIRGRFLEQQEVNIDLQTKYNELVAVSAGYLSEIQTLRGQIEELLVETQRGLHKNVPEDEFGAT